MLKTFFTSMHRATKRDYLGRMLDDKVHCMETASRFEADYWDGDRRYGYGGYRYDGRWNGLAGALIESYGLADDARILDVGCGKGFLLHELKLLLPEATVTGFDVSRHALEQAKPEVRDSLFLHRAEDPYPFADGAFDLVISLNVLHNLEIMGVHAALREMERLGENKYLCVESYRNDWELFNLQCWALTCKTFLSPEAWRWLFKLTGYGGDHEFIYFE